MNASGRRSHPSGQAPDIGAPLMICLSEKEWDLANCEELEQLLAPALEHPNVIINMTAVQFMDSSCLHKLIGMHNERVEQRGLFPARLVIASPRTRKLFAIVNLDQLWPIFYTVDEARRDARKSDGSAHWSGRSKMRNVVPEPENSK